MTTVGAASTLSARCAGPTALAILSAPGELVVEAVFDRSFYARDGNGGLLCFLRDDMEPGPLHVLCSPWPDRLDECLRAGDMARPVGERRYAAPALLVDASASAEWTPPAFPAVVPERLAPGVRALRDCVRRRAPRDSLAAWWLGVGETAEPWRDAFFRAAAKGLRALDLWLVSPGPHSPEPAAAALLGLGPGLTPSGDDVLAGALLSLHAVGLSETAERLAKVIAAAGPAATNRVSLAHLREAGRGMGAAALHDCLGEVVRDGDDLPAAVTRVGRIGHSSGWDVLCGMVCCLTGLYGG